MQASMLDFTSDHSEPQSIVRLDLFTLTLSFPAILTVTVFRLDTAKTVTSSVNEVSFVISVPAAPVSFHCTNS